MLKKVFCSICASLALLVPFCICASADEVHSEFSLAEVRSMIYNMAQGESLQDYICFDFNKDGVVNLFDIKSVVEILSNGGNNLNYTYTVEYFPTDSADTELTQSFVCGIGFIVPGYQSEDDKIALYGWNAIRESDGFIYCECNGKNDWYDPEVLPDNCTVKLLKPNSRAIIKASDGDVIRFYAVWREKMTVKYDSNGGIGQMNGDYAAYGVPFNLEHNKFTKGGYDFIGWNVMRESDRKYQYSDGSNIAWYTEGNQPAGYQKTLYQDGAKFSYDSQEPETLVMTAKWRQYYTVVFDANGGSGTMEAQKIYYGESNILAKNEFTRYGHDFASWYAYRHSDGKWYYYNPSGGDGWYKEGEAPEGYVKYPYKDRCGISRTSSIAGDTITMYANWRQYYTVVFDANGGSGTMETQKIYYGESNILAKNEFTRYGHDFASWYAYRHSDGKWYYYNPSGGDGWYKEGEAPEGYVKYPYKDRCGISRTSSIAGDTITMYANWRQYYTVVFNANGGSGAMSSQKIYYGMSTALRKNSFVKDYKYFNGWYAKRNSDGKWYYYNSSGGSGWYNYGSQPSGYVLCPYSDGTLVARTSSVAGDTVTMYANWTTAYRKEIYGYSYQGRELYAYIFNDTPKAAKTLFIDFAVHGFEDDYYRDGQVLTNCALEIAKYYMTDCSELKNYRLVLIPCANPDGTYAGTNNERACSTAFGRCTADHIDINRDFLTFAAKESRALRDMIKKYKPDVYVNCHGWLDTVLGNKEVGSIFVNTLGLSYNQYGDYGYDKGYIIGWVAKNTGAKSVLLEYKNPNSVSVSRMIQCINKIVSSVN